MKRQVIDPPKHPEETRDIPMDFSTALAVNDYLSGTYSVTVTDQETGVVKGSMVYGSATRSGNIVSAFITGGTSGKKYEILYKTQTAGGEVLVEILVLPVKK